MRAQELLRADDIVGESVVWDGARGALVWVDICGRRIHRYTLANRRHEVWPTPEFPTSVGLRRDGGAIVGLAHRVALWDWDGEFPTLAIPEPDIPDNRLNEGRVAPDGSFWVGTMQNNINDDGSPRDMTRNSGAIYRIDGEGRCERLTPSEYGISNTMAWTGDGRFLFADTLQDTIFQFEVAPDGKSIGKRAVFAGPLRRGLPDGSCLDADDRLWNCRVAGGAAVARFTAAGLLDELVDLPCSSPTSATFGGADLTTLYVTSSRFGMTSDELALRPWEGGLFAIAGAGRGRAEYRFAG